MHFVANNTEQASPQIKSMIKGLLTVNPKKRLCGKHGANELKNHPFYEGVNWGCLLFEIFYNN